MEGKTLKHVIAVIEDDNVAFENLSNMLNRFSNEFKQDFEIKWFKSGEEFLETIDIIYSIIFLDVDLPGINGLEIAKRIRDVNNVSSLIFVTNLAKYVQFGYEVDAVSYLIKPIEYNSFSLVFNKAINKYLSNTANDFIIKIPGGMEITSLDKLMYIEIMFHKLNYHLIDKNIEKTGSLKSIEKIVLDRGFIKCHNAFIVNPKFIERVDKNDLIINGDRIPVARNRRKEVLDKLSDYYMSK